MEGNSPYITNLVNSIIGVSVLAMPFCLKQCGIVLGLCLLFGAAWLTYISCSMLSNSAFYKRRRTYEYLALYTLGPTGKFTVELSMIGMMLGTCIAFYVVIGDLSNGILARFIDGADPHTLRVFTIIFCALCIALPLAMMKNLSVLSYFGFFSLTFYLGFVVVVILNAVSNGLLNWDWWWKVNLWRPAGIFQCLPIFSLAYACQCQLFIVYDSLEEPSVRRIEDIVSSAIKFVTVVYMCVGFFGYTTYSEHVAGNLLVSFPSNMLLDFIKLGFAMSVVLGFPLIIFPCRQSIHTLFFGKPVGEGLQPNTYIPPFLFKSITLMIVLSTMTVAIMIPNECPATSYTFDGKHYVTIMEKAPSFTDMTVCSYVTTDERGVIPGVLGSLAHSAKNKNFAVIGQRESKKSLIRINLEGQTKKIFTALPPSKEIHVCMVSSIKDNTATLFLNGQRTRALKFNKKLRGIPAGGVITIGRIMNNKYPMYRGTIRNFMMWDRGLTEDEILKIATKDHCPSGAKVTLLEKDVVPQEANVPASACIGEEFDFDNTGDKVRYVEAGQELPDLKYVTICVKVTTDKFGIIPGTIASYATRDQPELISVGGERDGGVAKLRIIVRGKSQVLDGQFAPNTAYRFCLVYHLPHGHVITYINGIQARVVQFSPMDHLPGGGMIIVGQRQRKIGGCFDGALAYTGKLDDFTVWGRALTSEELMKIGTESLCPTDAVVTTDKSNIVPHGLYFNYQIETILGLTGATMGSIICFIFPALIYDKANPKGSGFVAKFVFVVGCLLLVVCTYSNLANTGANAVDESKTPIVHDEPKLPVIDTRDINKEPVVDKQVESDDKKIDKDKIDKVEDKDKPEAVAEVHDDEHRHEPPIPIDPDNPANGNDNIRSPEDNDPAQNKDEDEKKPVESEKTVEKVVEDPAVVKEDLVKQDSPKVEHNIQPSSEKKQEEEHQHQPVVQSPVEKRHQEPVENEKEVVRESPKKEDIPVLKDSPQQVVEKPKSPAEKIQQQQQPDHQQQREINQPKSPAKEENVQKQQPPPVQHQQPVLEIKSPLNDNKNEARQPDNQEVKQPDKDINRKNEDKRDISDQNEPVQPQQGSQENKEAPKPDAAVNQDSQEADPAQEKELLEKIKIQHDKQQQLLIEQEQLIKKLEEHQDKKEQAAEERPIANDSPNNIENRGKEEETVIKQAQQPIVGNVDNEPVAPAAPIGGIDTGNAMPDRNLIPEKRVLGGGGEKVMLGREILSDYDNTPQISLGVDQMPHNAEWMPHGFDQVQHVNQVPFAVNQVPDSINQTPRRVDQIPHGIDQAANNINLEQGIVPQNHQRPQNVGSQKDALNENEEILLHEDNSKEKEPVRRQERALNEDSPKEMEKEENEDSETDNREEDSKLEADPDLENSESELNYFSESDNIEAKSIQVDQEIGDNLNDKLTLKEGNNLQESELSENKKNNLLTQNDEVDKVDKILQPRLDGGVGNIEPPSPGLGDPDSDYDETAKVEAEKMISDCLENDEKCWQGKAKVRELKSLDQVDL